MPAMALPTDITQGLMTQLVNNPLDMRRIRELLMGSEQERKQKALENPLNLQLLQQKVKMGNLGMPEAERGAAEANLGLSFLQRLNPAMSSGAPPPQNPLGKFLLPEQLNPPAPSAVPAPMDTGVDLGKMGAPQPGQKPIDQMTLEELMDFKAGAGPESGFIGKFVDPMINRKLTTEQLVPALQEIEKAAAMAGGTREEARRKGAALSSIAAKYPLVTGDPRFKEAMSLAAPKNTDVVMMPYMHERNIQADVSSLRSRSTANSKDYKVAKDALATADREYENFLKDPQGTAARVHQQGIIDKYIIVSINRPATEAQFEMAQQFPGLLNYMDQATGKLKVGSIVPKAIIDAMMKNMRESAIQKAENLKQLNAVDAEAAAFSDIAPERILNYPDKILDRDIENWRGASARQEQPAGAPKEVPKDVLDLARKVLANPKATPERKAKAKRILGLQSRAGGLPPFRPNPAMQRVVEGGYEFGANADENPYGGPG